MTERWKMVYSTADAFRAELLKGLLESRDVYSIILNKRDTQFDNFGFRELYVPTDQVVTAIKIIQDAVEDE